MNARYLSIILSVLVLMFVFELVRREKLTFKYAMGWIFVLSLAVFCAVFDDLLYALSDRLGFALTSNFIFYVILGGFVFLSLLMTIFLCQQNGRNDAIAQKLGLLEEELRELKKKTGSEL
ncbi:MAG: DUF2304 domain-containing protein [Candidatus Omnitrophota bacterium]|nr:DUF2304 domain-containing protein [Candidatus Omnitrophota bacterium]MDZ4242726.1 DUF2304 domain-containing protein [Candidatus Omnitrophota bacterium]